MIARDFRVGDRLSTRMFAQWLLPLTVAAGVLGGCQSASEPLAAGAPAQRQSSGNVEARLVGIGGSSANGSVFLHDVKGGVDAAIWLGSAGPGEYRVVIHENGNCTSPNGFSAGPPWAPPGVPLAVVLLRKNDDTRTLTVHLPGYRVQGPDGIMGRSVVVHDRGSGPLDAQPGVRNNRISCAVIGAPEELFPRLGI